MTFLVTTIALTFLAIGLAGYARELVAHSRRRWRHRDSVAEYAHERADLRRACRPARRRP